jgi:hypothetical protein
MLLLADPQSVTINAVAKSLPAIARDTSSSTYRMDTGDYELVVSHQFGKRNRFSVRLNAKKIAADPLTASNNLEYRTSAYLVIDAPPVGYTNTELKDIVLGLTGWLTSANVLKVVGGET